MDGRTKKVLFHSWMNGNWNKRHVDNSVFSNNEWKESNYGNPPNTATDTFFKAYEEGNELIQMKHKEDNKNDEQSNKKVCKTEMFEAIEYLLGPNEEYIAIRRCEHNAWERNEDSVSQMYQEIFQKRTTNRRASRNECRNTRLVGWTSSHAYSGHMITTSKTPFTFIYRTEALIPIEVLIHTERVAMVSQDENKDSHRLDLALEEEKCNLAIIPEHKTVKY
nr:reverse transcriptase domain-containing protein [Tanacetum cinerariifolium]